MKRSARGWVALLMAWAEAAGGCGGEGGGGRGGGEVAATVCFSYIAAVVKKVPSSLSAACKGRGGPGAYQHTALQLWHACCECRSLGQERQGRGAYNLYTHQSVG